jgi:hypothetical protein
VPASPLLLTLGRKKGPVAGAHHRPMSPASHARRSGPGEDGFIQWSGAGLEGNRDLRSETGVAPDGAFRKTAPDNVFMYTRLLNHVLAGDCYISPKLAPLAPPDTIAGALNLRIGLAAKEET